MKKSIFSFAIMAATAVAMVSCGNKTENAAASEAAAEGEQATEQVAEQEVQDENALSTDAFSMSAPEGFELNGKAEYLQKNHEVSFRTKAGVVPTYLIKINHDANITFDARQSDIAKLTTIDPIKVGDVSFQGGWQPDGKSLVLYADLGDKGTARVFFPKPSGTGAPADDAAVVAKLAELLSALKFK